MKAPDFWNDKKESEKIISTANSLKDMIDKVKNLKEKIESNFEMIEELRKSYDEELVEMISSDIEVIGKELDEVEVLMLLSGPYDKDNAIVEIHSGAGGTEACDWANMLYRMYTRWCEKKNYKVEVIDSQPGEEVGIKSLTMFVKGMNAFGYLKNEKGVHRLVRISPFDANNKRHTSFASVDITPEFTEVGDVIVDEKDLKIDVYRSSGAGGQHVNTTDSAVRITHLPTKIVVSCQNQRSQIQNREEAMNMLKSKLKLLELEKRQQELHDVKGESMNIEFGSQIRSYVMHPYSLVKDHRTGYETSNVLKVLDGDIFGFIESYLKQNAKK